MVSKSTRKPFYYQKSALYPLITPKEASPNELDELCFRQEK